ncbi:MAG: hypothetical protein QG622_3642 [Actinomycetota bacterium]|nr:hypothetical protein [Actinomycetota bacterium]
MKSSGMRDFPLFNKPMSYIAYVTVSAGYLWSSDGWIPRVISGATLALSTYLLVDYALTKRAKDQAAANRPDGDQPDSDQPDTT